MSPRHRVYQELGEGTAGNISCRIEGNVASYRWVLPNRRPLSSRVRAVGNILTISPVLKDDAGTYLCVAQSGSNNNQIVEARVNVTIQGTFTSTVTYKYFSLWIWNSKSCRSLQNGDSACHTSFHRTTRQKLQSSVFSCFVFVVVVVVVVVVKATVLFTSRGGIKWAQSPSFVYITRKLVY